MNRYIIGSLWDRANRNGTNKNFEYLFEGSKRVDALNRRADNILNKSNATLNEAQQTNDMNENVQQQINTLIAESGTSDAETIQARIDAEGNEYDVLKDRLDKKDSLLEETSGVSFEFFGAIGDGITDDTQAITNTIQYASENNIHKINGTPGKVYVLKEVQHIEKDNLTINWNGAKIKWLGETVIESIQGDIGMFNITGSIDGGDDPVAYARSLTGVHNVPEKSRTLNSVEKYSDNQMTGSKIKTSENFNFNVGDDILIMGWTRANRFPYDVNKFEPELRTVAKIWKIDADYIYTDYVPDFDITDFVSVPTERSLVVKVNLVKNVHIINVEIENAFEVTTPNSLTYLERAVSTSGIRRMLTENCTVNNVSIKNHVWNAFYNWFSRNLEDHNISAHTPQMWIGGSGYAVQNIGVSHSNIKNVHGEQCRHVVDYSWSHHCKTTNGTTSAPRQTDFNQHGCNEHDITFENCGGHISFGNGISTFPEIMGKVTIENCEGLINHTFQSYIKELKINNSKIKTQNFLYAKELKMIDTDWDMELAYEVTYIPTRGLSEVKTTNIDARIKLVLNPNDAHNNLVGMRGVENITFTENTTIETDFDTHALRQAYPRLIRFDDTETFKFRGKMIDVAMYFYVIDKTLSIIDFRGTTAHYSDTYTSTSPMRPITISNSHVVIFLDGMSLTTSSEGSGTITPIHITNSVDSGSRDMQMDVFVRGASLSGNATNSVSLANSTSGTVADLINIIDGGNIIRHPTNNHGFDTGSNIII